MPSPALSNPVNQTCPWSGDRVRSDSLTRYRGHVVGFCNSACRDRFERALSELDQAIDRLAEKPGVLD